MLKYALTAAFAVCLSGGALAEGDPKKGKRVFNKCKACHTLEEGKHKSGPSLYKIVGATAGVQEDYRYSKPMADSGLIWDMETLTAFLTDPKEVVPGNKMSFSGLKKQSEIDNVIAYIQEESE